MKRGKITSYLIIAIMVTIMIMMLLGLGTIFYPAIGLRDTHAAQTASATDEKAAEVINAADFAELVTGKLRHLTSGSPTSALLETERTDGGYYTIIDEQKKTIDCTARILSKGDEFITAKNMRYQVTSIKGDYAHARLVGEEAEAKLTSTPKNSIWSQLIGRSNSHIIGIYHTHSDESYVPSDGTDSIYANGGIFKVGKVAPT